MVLNIFITGITGFIGAHLADYLSINKENNIYGLYRSIKHESTFNALKLQERKNINLILGNVNIYPDIEELINEYNINQMYHLAAQSIVKTAQQAPTPTYIVNVLGTINILEAIRLVSLQQNKQIPTLVMSSDKAYGASNKLPYKEDLPLNGLDIYSSSKACQDIIARAYAYNYELPIVISRPCNAYGLDFNWSRLIPSLAKACLSQDEKNKPLILNKGSYKYIREYIYVKDLVKAMESLIKNINKTKGNAYNITSAHNKLTTEELVNMFLKLTNNESKEIVFKEKQTYFKEIESQYLDSTKLLLDTGWCSEYSIINGLNETIDLYRNWFVDEMLEHCSTHEADLYI